MDFFESPIFSHRAQRLFCSAIALYKEDFLTRSRRYIVFSAIAFIMRYNICIDGDFFTPLLSLSGTVRGASLTRPGRV